LRSWTEAERIGWPRRYGPGAYLERIDPPAAARAREHYACFEQFGGESQEYGRAVSLGISEPWRRGVIEQLQELHRNSVGYLRRDGLAAEDDQSYAEQNARLVANAEEYYRTMFSTRASSWNLRDTHMADTLRSLLAHVERHGERAKLVVWAHNSHVGDARRTEMGDRGELNLGQLIRSRPPTARSSLVSRPTRGLSPPPRPGTRRPR
jgi:erythromycin esterase-like protein